MGNNLVPYSITIGEEKIHFFTEKSSLLKEKALKTTN